MYGYRNGYGASRWGYGGGADVMLAPYKAILTALSAQGTPADDATKAWLAANFVVGTPWMVLSNPSDRITLLLRGTGTAKAWWGDGNTQSSALSGSDTIFSHVYASAATRGVIVLGNVTEFISTHATDGTASWTINIAFLPSSLKVLNVWGGSSAAMGDIASLPSGMTYLDVGDSSSVVTGDITSLPSSMTRLNVGNTRSALTGDIASLPSGMVYLNAWNSSSVVTGDIASLPSGMTYLNVGYTSSAVTGDIAFLPSGMTYFNVWNSSSAVTGDIASLPSSMAYLNTAGGSNDLSCTSNSLPSTLSYLRARGLTLQEEVDRVLNGMVLNIGAPKPRNDRYVHLSENGAIPSASGWADYDTLVAAGYTVIVSGTHP